MTGEIEVERAVQRAVDSKQSKQGETAALTWTAVLRWAESKPPTYSTDVRDFDKWHVDFVRKEPHLNGVLSQAVSLVKNRGWTLTGGKIQVNRVKAILHDADRKAGGRFGDGYRSYVGRMARSFYLSCFGAISELGRDEPPRFAGGMTTAGPLRAVWSADPTRFVMRTRQSEKYPIAEFPVKYYPSRGRVQYWRHGDFMRIVDNQSILQDMNGIGYAAVPMARELAEIIVAIYEHDKSELGARAPKGLLILNNIGEDQWDKAMRSRKAKIEGYEEEYFGDVAVLAGSSVEQVDAKLIALSSLPAQLKRSEAIDYLMFLYALLFKYSPDEFWPVRGGSFGRGTEAKIGVERATQKGDADFFAAFQESFQRELPASVLMEYDERDDRGRRIEAEITQIYSDIAGNLYQAGAMNVEGPLFSRQMALSFLVNTGVIPPEWSEIAEEVELSDTDQARMRYLQQRLMDESPQVRRAVEMYPDQPIVRYCWPSNREIVVWRRGADAIRPSYLVSKKRAVLYRNDDVDLVIDDEDVDESIETGANRLGDEFEELLNAPPIDEE